MLRFSLWKASLVMGLVLLGFVYALPTLLPQNWRTHIPAFLPDKAINLGLDLQGGSHLLLEVDIEAARKERLELLADDARQKLRDKSLIPFTERNVTKDGVIIRLQDPAQTSEAVSRLRTLRNPVQTSIGNSGRYDTDVTSPSPGVVELNTTAEGLAEIQRRTVAASIEVVRRRIDELGTRETNVQRQGDQRIIVEAPGENDPSRLRQVIETTAKMSFNLVDQDADLANAVATGRAPAGSKLLTTDNPNEPFLLVKSRAVLTGEELTDAQPSFDQSGDPVVSFRFNQKGARAFGVTTAQNVGKRFAIVLDDKVISAPVIETPIYGGSGIIRGSFTTESATNLSVLMRAGSLPAPLKVVESRTVGAELGADSVRAGFISSIIALGLVVGFIFLVYGGLGLFANLGLVANIFLLLGLMAAIGGTLTLPGIAGVILTMGMAVDANVLIYERVREEIRNGRGVLLALENGYQRTFWTILDANLTTLIAAGIMFYLGSGAVKGFAVTLGLGIFTSILTSFWFARLLTGWWVLMAKPKKLAL